MQHHPVLVVVLAAGRVLAMTMVREQQRGGGSPARRPRRDNADRETSLRAVGRKVAKCAYRPTVRFRWTEETKGTREAN
jgi:hypothetical protein